MKAFYSIGIGGVDLTPLALPPPKPCGGGGSSSIIFVSHLYLKAFYSIGVGEVDLDSFSRGHAFILYKYIGERSVHKSRVLDVLINASQAHPFQTRILVKA